MRLIGDFPTDEAFQELKRCDSEDLHRDVKVALLRALWNHLHHPESWEILNRAAESPDPALMHNAVRIPAGRLGDDGRKNLIGLLCKMIRHPDATVRVQVLQRCIELPVADPERNLLMLIMNCVRTQVVDERRVAVRALVACCREVDAELLATEFQSILKNRRAMVELVQQLLSTVHQQPLRLRPVATELLNVLSSDPLILELKISLANLLMSGTEFAQMVEQLAADDSLHPDALARVRQCIAGWPGDNHRSELEALESRFAASSDARLRRLAVSALVAQSGLFGGWDKDRLRRLKAYRKDESPLVASFADFTLPSEELELSGASN